MLLGAMELITFSLLIYSTFLLLLLILLFLRKPLSTPLLFLCILLLSATRFSLSTYPRPNDINQFRFNRSSHYIHLIGKINSIPKSHPRNSSQSFSLASEALQNNKKEWEKKRGTLFVRYYGKTSLHYGDQLLLHGILKQQHFPGQKQLQLSVSENKLTVLPNRSFSFDNTIEKLREKGAKTLSKGIKNHPTQCAIYQALLLGYRGNIPKNIYQTFIRTGTVHIFAISGLHVGIIALFIIILIKSLGVPLNKWSLLLLPLLFLYVYSTGMKSSALRAWTMAAIYFLAPLFRRKPNVPNAIALAFILILWIKPTEILAPGFIYSFIIVSFLVMVFSVISPNQITGELKGWKKYFLTYFLTLAICSTTAFLAALPLTALFFGRIAPIALIANLIVVPLTFFIVLAGWLSLIIPFASTIFNYAALAFIDSLLFCVQHLAHIPYAQCSVTSPSIPAILLWYGSWTVFLIYSKTKRQRHLALTGVLLSILWTLLL